jgi:hypothetical protein
VTLGIGSFGMDDRWKAGHWCSHSRLSTNNL